MEIIGVIIVILMHLTLWYLFYCLEKWNGIKVLAIGHIVGIVSGGLFWFCAWSCCNFLGLP